MSALKDATLVTLTRGKHHFEALAKQGSIQKFRDQKIGLSDALLAEQVFLNHSKFEVAPDAALRTAFDTTNMQDCLNEILLHGEFRLSTSERKEKVEKKRREIVGYLHKYYVDPRSNLPHPVTRIESALSEIKGFVVDPETPVERQVQDLLKKLVGVITLKKASMEGTLLVTHAFVGQCQGIVRKWCDVNDEKFTKDGCSWEVSFLPGSFDSLMADLTRATKGSHQFHPHAAAAAASGVAEPEPKAKGKKKKKGK